MNLKIAEDCGYRDPAGRIPFEQVVVYRTSKVRGSEYLTLDLLEVTPVLEEAWKTRQFVRWKDRIIQVVSAAGLAQMKRLAARDQDWVDLKKLGYDDAETTDRQDGGGSEAQAALLNVADTTETFVGGDGPDAEGPVRRRAVELLRTEFEERTWQAFWQVVIDGQAPADVAQCLGMTVGTVYQAKSRVLRRLRDEFRSA